MMKKIPCLIKFGRSEHMKDLLEKGKLYCNHINTFKDYNQFNENTDSKIGDVNEGVSKTVSTDGWLMKINSPGNNDFICYPIKHGVLKEFIDYNVHVYCMHLTEGDSDEKAIYIKAEVLKEFQEYDAYVAIFDVESFVKRVEAIESKTLYDKIIYYNPLLTNKDLTLFHKTTNYKDQNEYRFIFPAKNKEPRVLMLGSLEDIADFGLVENIINL